ncbi:head-tail adaptor protein [Acinetobacter pittii]|uniref:Phage head closure protein n=1 Tax=Acinetobacter pittii TaxID=48296 RepID=A0AAE9M7T5_ACIPI|nr:phage head closure protein [Acinetobacter pittii]AZP30400.1 head-tail adaptor protein [Acinetobacter pittii]USU93780.1 phage head closure protein [Acinetobacter pittii]
MGQNAGELRHRVIIQHYIEGGRDEDGFPIECGWSEYKKLWAKITPLSAKDLIAAQADQSEVVARMKIRYREDITTKMQVLWKGRIFSIQSQALDDSEDSYTYGTFLLGQGLEKPK